MRSLFSSATRVPSAAPPVSTASTSRAEALGAAELKAALRPPIWGNLPAAVESPVQPLKPWFSAASKAVGLTRTSTMLCLR
jgi:hypothetical protein